MEQNDFSVKIEKHRAKIKKYKAVSDAVGCVKLVLALLLGFFIALSFYFMFSGSLQAKMIIWCLISGASLVAVWIYHDKIRDKIKHSNDMISTNKRHLGRIADIESSNGYLQPYFSSDEYAKQQAAVTNLNRETGFSNFYENTIKKDASGNFTQIQVEEPDDPEVFAKATAIKFLLM